MPYTFVIVNFVCPKNQHVCGNNQSFKTFKYFETVFFLGNVGQDVTRSGAFHGARDRVASETGNY